MPIITPSYALLCASFEMAVLDYRTAMKKGWVLHGKMTQKGEAEAPEKSGAAITREELRDMIRFFTSHELDHVCGLIACKISPNIVRSKLGIPQLEDKEENHKKENDE